MTLLNAVLCHFLALPAVHQIHDLEGLSHKEASIRVAAAFQTMMGHLPPDTLVFIPQLACIPGCIMLLANLVLPCLVTLDEQAQQQQEQEEVMAGGVEPYEAQQGRDNITVYAGTDQAAAGVGMAGPQYSNGVWNLALPEGRDAGIMYMQFSSISSFEGAVKGRMSLQTAAAAGVAGGGGVGADSDSVVAAMLLAAAGTYEADPVVVAAWGRKLQLSLGLPSAAGCEAATCNAAPPNSITSSTEAGVAGSSSVAVRAVLLKGGDVVMDQEVKAKVEGFHLSVQLVLPSAKDAGTSTEKPGAAALYILPAVTGKSTLSSSRIGSATVALPPVMQVSLLLLPVAARSELGLWMEQLQLTQRQLQPLLQDMVVAVEAAVVTATGSSTAAVPCFSSSVSMPTASGVSPGMLVELAASAVERVVCVFQECGLGLCEDVMAVCKQQLLVAFRRLQPLAAGSLPPRSPSSDSIAAADPDTAAADAAVCGNGAAAGASAGFAAGAGTAAKVGSSKLSEAAGASVLQSADGGSGKLDLREGRDGGLGRKAAVAATAASLWWYVRGALIGWRDEELESGYVSCRLQNSSKYASWVMMGIMDLCFHVFTASRVLLNLYSGVYAVPQLLDGAKFFCVAALLQMVPSIWMVLCSAKSWRHVGTVAVAVELLRLTLFHMHGCVGGFSALEEIMLDAANKTSPGHAISLVLFTAVRIVLHQLPPPWLLPHALVSACAQWWVYTHTPRVWTILLPSVALWQQLLVVCAVGVVAVVWQEAAKRMKYIKGLARQAA